MPPGILPDMTQPKNPRALPHLIWLLAVVLAFYLGRLSRDRDTREAYYAGRADVYEMVKDRLKP